ncbi:MAG: hypothetical protein J6R80_04540 [Kiritimatiellae bacterium]|nr:hypothetical protein [Kiritimatiellia bacterium]
MMLTKKLAATVFALFLTAGYGAEIAFPLAGGDLSSAEAWGGQTPLSTDTVLITNSGVYTALSSDLAYAALGVNANDVTFDFSATPTRKVLFNSQVELALTMNVAKSTTTFKGGEWAVADSASANFYCGTGKNGNRLDNHSVYMDGCVWTNLNRVYMGYAEGNCKLTMQNDSRVYAKQCFVGNGTPTGNKLHILEGSKMFLSDTQNPFYSDNGTHSSDPNAQILVAGEGSLISAPSGIFQVGNSHSGIQLLVTNDASVVAGTVYVGRQNKAVNCGIAVVDGASFSAQKILVSGGNGCMIVSNAELTVRSMASDALTVGSSGLSGQSFTLAGKSSALNYYPPRADVFATGADSAEFSIIDNAMWNVTSNIVRFAVAAKDCVFKVANDALFSINGGLGTMEFGPGSSNPTSVTSVSNRVEITDGAVLKIRELRLSGEGNSLDVCDASVVYEGSDVGYLYIGYTGPDAKRNGIISSNCVAGLRGKNPKIYAPNSRLYIYPSCKLRVEIPEEGYEEGYTPINVKSIAPAGEPSYGSIEIECAEFVEKTGGTLTIAQLGEVVGAGSGLEKLLLATAQTLPKGCRLLWNNKTIVLKSRRNIGSVMIVR